MKFYLKILFNIIVINLIITTSSYSWKGDNIPKKKELGNEAYNYYIQDYNKFKNNFNKNVIEYCNNISITVAEPSELVENSKCAYNEAVRLAKEYNFFYDDFADELYSWHRDYFRISKGAAMGLIKCYKNSCRNVVWELYDENWISIQTKLFKNLDRILKQMAEEANRIYYAQKKEEKDNQLPQIADDEIVAASSGTGFLISKQGHLVTNNHVIDGCTHIKAIYNGIEYDSKVLAVDRVNDLALIKSEIKPKKIYSVSNQDAQLLEDVIVAGYPLGKKISGAIKATSGTVTALAGMGDNYAEFQTDAALNSGNSGGPIINDMGNVVGVAVSKIQKEGVDSFNFGIKSSVLKIFANANGFNFSPPGNKEMKKKDLGALITEATIYLDCWMKGRDIKKLIAQDKKSQKAFYSKFSKISIK